MKKRIVSLAALSFVLAFSAISQPTISQKHRVVVQLNEPEGPAWSDLTVHVNNLLANLAQDGGVKVEIVFFGPGLNMLRKTNVAYERRFRQFIANGVTFAACQNSMAAMRLNAEDLFPFVSQVRSGVAEVVRKQEAGWTYLH